MPYSGCIGGEVLHHQRKQTMTTRDWRQFSRMPWNDTIADAVGVLPVEIPPEGRPIWFCCGGFVAAHSSSGHWIVIGPGSEDGRYVDSPQDVLHAACHLPAGDSRGDALRQWLEMWAT